ncbi:MAG: cupin domain-containing protein [Pseudomonadales bacterium]|nr:cupin domain-containing protein [Pseudomonadales bacterium]MCJ8338660.1 cupin domain-containing protein [Pseudomonadales bacterium]NRA16246.1 cupin domain-containing protein [Oceanospirillaceae bacterium]
MGCVTQGKFSVPMDVEQVTTDWQKRGFGCSIYVDAPGQQWIDFVHSTNELVMVLDGQLRMLVGDEEFIAEPGDEVFIAKNTYHSLYNTFSGTTRWLYGYD